MAGLGVGHLQRPDAAGADPGHQFAEQQATARHIHVLQHDAAVHQVIGPGGGAQRVVRQQQFDPLHAVALAVVAGFLQHGRGDVQAGHGRHLTCQRHHDAADAAAEVQRAAGPERRVQVATAGVQHMAHMVCAGVEELLAGAFVQVGLAELGIRDDGEVGVLLAPLAPGQVGAGHGRVRIRLRVGYQTDDTRPRNFWISLAGALLTYRRSRSWTGKCWAAKKLRGSWRLRR